MCFLVAAWHGSSLAHVSAPSQLVDQFEVVALLVTKVLLAQPVNVGGGMEFTASH